MKSKTCEKIKYVVVSCIVLLSLIVSVNAPSFYFAETLTVVAKDSYSGAVHGSLQMNSGTVIPDSVFEYTVTTSSGTNTAYVFDAFYDLYPVAALEYDFYMLDFIIKSATTSLTSSEYVTGYDVVLGTIEEIRSGDGLIIPLPKNGSLGLNSEGNLYEISKVIDYGVGAQLYICVVVHCRYTCTPDTIVVPTLNMNFVIDFEVDGVDIAGVYNLLYIKLDDILGELEDNGFDTSGLLTQLKAINANTDTLESKLQSLIDFNSSINSYISLINTNIADIESKLTSLNSLVTQISTKLDKIQTSLDNVNTELNTHTSWLEKIWNSIQEFLTPDKESQDKQDDFSNSVNNQVGQLGNMSGSMDYDKPDIDNINVNVNAYIPQEYIDNYSQLLKVFTNHTVVKDMLLIAFTVCIISYTLFGKRR